MIVHLDTHVVTLLLGKPSALPKRARQTLNNAEQLMLSSVVVLELQFLREIGKLKASPTVILSALRDDLGVVVADATLSNVVDVATGLSWTRDPFDRLIVAHANLDGATLVTRDGLMAEHYPKCVWA